MEAEAIKVDAVVELTRAGGDHKEITDRKSGVRNKVRGMAPEIEKDNNENPGESLMPYDHLEGQGAPSIPKSAGVPLEFYSILDPAQDAQQ